MSSYRQTILDLKLMAEQMFYNAMADIRGRYDAEYTRIEDGDAAALLAMFNRRAREIERARTFRNVLIAALGPLGQTPFRLGMTQTYPRVPTFISENIANQMRQTALSDPVWYPMTYVRRTCRNCGNEFVERLTHRAHDQGICSDCAEVLMDYSYFDQDGDERMWLLGDSAEYVDSAHLYFDEDSEEE